MSRVGYVLYHVMQLRRDLSNNSERIRTLDTTLPPDVVEEIVNDALTLLMNNMSRSA
jgi:hypothetical protein